MSKIPKIIHYCWFGGNPLPKSAYRCIESWKKYFPDYEIKEWNESNFDCEIIPYVKEAYKAKKFAFVSDYARFYVLYNYGGIYFDVDVEVINSMKDILEVGPFMGCEYDPNYLVDGKLRIAPGLGIAAYPQMEIYKNILDVYSKLSFRDEKNIYNFKTVGEYITEYFFQIGLKNENRVQEIKEIYIYPQEYFCPFDNNTGILNITDKTKSIHWYNMSWLPKKTIFKSRITRVLHRYFGVHCFEKIKGFYKK